MEHKEEIYKKRIKEILKKTEGVRPKKIPEWEKSYEIMKQLRKEYLFIHTDYLKTPLKSPTATLIFNDPKIRFNIEKGDEDLLDYHVLYANSFGPFNPEAYFKSHIKIIWLLKEPNIERIGNWIGQN